jgi:hypothetical protein
MADFYPILARAVAGLPDKSPDARRAVYDRARSALVAQLRSLDPPLGEAEIMRERLSLDEAVARIEADYGDGPATLPGEAAPIFRPAAEAGAQPAGPAPAPAAALPPDPLAPESDPFALPSEPTERQATRPRVEPPRERRINPRHIRTTIVGGGIAAAVIAIAGTAYYIHKVRPQDAAQRPRVETPAQPVQPDNAGKLNDRVGEAPPQTAPARPGADQPPAAQQPDVAVAQRAILYTETPDNPQQPTAASGRAVWRLDSEGIGQGRPVETIIRATVEIAGAGLSLDFTIRRNTDPAFPASHIIGMRFTSTGDPATQGIREVGVPQFKTDENERGAPLSAINSALGDNLFVAALSNVPVEVERNLELMGNRNWIDVPVRFASGRRGIITFEKGISGSQVLMDALNRWR